jgi:hypothetical protein
MSEQNVEIVREAHERFTKTGEPLWERIDADTEVFDHDIPDARNPYRGAAGDRVVSLFRIRAVGVGSGAAVERGDGMVWTFRGDKLVRLDYFNGQAQALEAVGLGEPSKPSD